MKYRRSIINFADSRSEANEFFDKALILGDSNLICSAISQCQNAEKAYLNQERARREGEIRKIPFDDKELVNNQIENTRMLVLRYLKEIKI